MTTPAKGMRFPRSPWLAPGYHVSDVDALIERIEATLGGFAWSSQAITAADVRQAMFRTTRRGGYDQRTVDQALDLYAEQLDSAAQQSN